MILRRIEIQNFRKFVAPVVLANLPDGLVVVAGGNEDGKSTFLLALRAAFFYKHTWSGKLVERLRPYDSEVAPQITVDFEAGNGRYRLKKRFCQQKCCELAAVGGPAWEGDAAEEELARLLGAALPGRAPQSGEETGSEGPLGLLWLTQGAAWHLALSDTGRGGLRSLLEREVGEVLGGPRAQRILDQASAERNLLLTSTGRPTGALKETAEHKQTLQTKCGELQANLDRCDGLRNSLTANLARLADHERQLPALLDRRSQAEQRRDTARNLKAGLDLLQTRSSEVREREQRLAAELQRRHLLRAELAAADQESRQRAAAAVAENDALDLAAEAHRAAAHLLLGRDQDLQAAERRLAALDAQIEMAEAQARRGQIQQDLDRARTARQARLKCEAEAARLPDLPAVQKLRLLAQKVQNAEMAMQAAATRVRIELQPGATATVEGEPQPSGWAGTLSQPARVEIARDGQMLAAVDVAPAGTAADPLKELQARRAEWQKSAALWQIESLADAEQKLQRRGQAETEAALAARDGDRFAPDGIEKLELDLELLQSRLAQLRPVAPDDLLPPESLPGARAEAQNTVIACRNRHQTAQSQALTAQALLDAATQRRGTAEREAQSAADKLQARQSALGEEQARLPDDALRDGLTAARREADALAAEIEPLARRLGELDPDRIERELAMAAQACDNLNHDSNNLQRDIARQRGELSGAEAWGEQHQAALSELEYFERRHAELERRASELKLLCDTLAQARDQAEARFVGPVLDRVRPLLHRLLPGTELQLGADMEVRGLRRGQASEPFETLSLGTREQLAILVRLGFAELLRDNGRSAVTILDDAPAYSDATRFEAILGVLHDAAQATQIIILTCREHEFRRSGARVVRLAAAGGAGA